LKASGCPQVAIFSAKWLWWSLSNQKNGLDHGIGAIFSLQTSDAVGVLQLALLTPIFYSIVEAFNVVLLGALEPEKV
jgi:hypothetical protein